MAEGITHIDTSTTAPKLADGVVLLQDLPGVGEAPGVTAYVHYNGPTDQLATMCAGMAVLEPGATPHPPHRHVEEEFMTVVAGTGEIVVNGDTTQVSPGSVMYCAAHVLHGITNTGDVPMTFYFSKWLGKPAAEQLCPAHTQPAGLRGSTAACSPAQAGCIQSTCVATHITAHSAPRHCSPWRFFASP